MSEEYDRQRTVLGNTDDDPTRRTVRRPLSDQSITFAVSVAGLLHDRHLEQVVVLDLDGLSDLTDCIVIATATSERQIQSVGREVVHFAADHDIPIFGQQYDTPATWSVLDFVDVVVHLFDAETRAFYDLEMMWGDAAIVDWDGQVRDASS